MFMRGYKKLSSSNNEPLQYRSEHGPGKCFRKTLEIIFVCLKFLWKKSMQFIIRMQSYQKTLSCYLTNSNSNTSDKESVPRKSWTFLFIPTFLRTFPRIYIYCFSRIVLSFYRLFMYPFKSSRVDLYYFCSTFGKVENFRVLWQYTQPNGKWKIKTNFRFSICYFSRELFPSFQLNFVFIIKWFSFLSVCRCLLIAKFV